MPIKKRLAQVTAARSGSTHSGNDTKFSIEQGDSEIKNHMSGDTLTDPEDCTPGSTHSMKKIKASTDQQNVGTLDIDEDPAAGYLVGAGEEDDDEMEDIPEDENVEASFEVEGEEEPDNLNNNNGNTPLTAEAEGDWYTPPEDGEPTETDDSIEDIEDDESAESGEGIVPDEVEDMPIEGEALPIVDIDETPDTSTGDVAFASMGTRLMVIRANRIIATMTQKMALASGREDIYLSDQFQEVTATQLKAKGLRRGLKTMGFTLAKVNVSKASVVNARVQLAVSKTTAAVRKVEATKEEAFQQSLTIAAVGINRRYFNEQPNELKAHLEAQLQQAGIKGGNKMLQTAFSKFGPAYAKSIVELANKIAAMPAESRAGYVSALDLTSEDMDTPGEDVVPIGAEGEDDTSSLMGTEDDDSEFEDDTITASLSRPATKLKASSQGRYSVEATAALSGDVPLFI